MNQSINTDSPNDDENKELHGDYTPAPEVHSFIDLQNVDAANRTVGGLIGLLVGDAVGVPYEFHSPDQLPIRELIDMSPPAGFNRSHKTVPVGTWSDDGAQALCLYSCLQTHFKVELRDFAQRLCDWYEDGFFAVDEEKFDVGIQTEQAIRLMIGGTDPLLSGSRDESNNGNGSLMRVLPLALYHSGKDADLVKEAHLQSMPTHAHPRSLVACAYYCLVARGYLNESENSWEEATTKLQAIYENWHLPAQRNNLLNELELILTSPLRDNPTGSGYVVDTLWSAKKAMEESTFEDVIKTAILFGNDTDTTACVAGGLAGIRFGLGGIPARWLEQLRGWDEFRTYYWRYFL